MLKWDRYMHDILNDGPLTHSPPVNASFRYSIALGVGPWEEGGQVCMCDMCVKRGR